MKRTIVSMTAMVVCLGMARATLAGAQSPTTPVWLDAVNSHHRMQYQMMKDMTEIMGGMTEQMSQSELTPEYRKQMAERMARMSTLMGRMSGLESRPAMREPEWQKQMDDMRKQMDGMIGDSRMAPGAR